MEFQTVDLLADWIESSVLLSASGHLANDRLEALAMSELGASSARLHSALRTMARRAKMMGDLYPLKVIPDLAVRTQDSQLRNMYLSLLALTPGSAVRQVNAALDVHVLGEQLEQIAVIALANFWGSGGKAVRFAYPSEIGRPKEFDQAVNWLAKIVGIAPGGGYRPPRRKDGGVDVVAWRSFPDARTGFPVALAQCTVQDEKFTKTTDIDIRLWSTWLAMDQDPLSLLVLPGTIPRSGPEWSQLTSVVTVIERFRLLDLISRDMTDPKIEDSWGVEQFDSIRESLRISEY